MLAGARHFIDVPAPPVAAGGLLRAARVIDVQNSHDLMGVQYETDACAEAHEWREWCTMTPENTKLFDQDPEFIEGDPFAVYAGVACELQQLSHGEDRARRRFAYAEGRAVDQAVLTWLDDNAIDLGGPVPLTQGIGIAEAYAAAFYGGVPTIIVPRLMVPCGCACGGITTGVDGSLVTCQGSLVA